MDIMVSGHCLGEWKRRPKEDYVNKVTGGGYCRAAERTKRNMISIQS